MKQTKLHIFFLLLSLFACKPENSIDNLPSNFIEKDRFIELVYDVNVLEGNLGNFNLNKDLLMDSSMQLYKGIFEKYYINYEDFKENQEYYILTDQYREVSKKALELVITEEEKYTEIKPINILSFIQFNQLFEANGHLDYMEKDTSFSYSEKLDSMLNYYRVNPASLKDFSIDSISFVVNISKLRKGKDLFKDKLRFKKPVLKNINE
jgi:hypothetical protein